MFRVTENIAATSFEHINKKVFNGILDRPFFDVDYLDTEYGYYDPSVDAIGLTDVFESKRDFEDTLCHEMAHLCQVQVFGMKPDHGHIFHKLIKHARKVGVAL